MATFWVALLFVTFGRGYQNTSLPAYDNGYLLFTIRPNRVEVWGPDGQQRFSAVVENPPAVSVSTIAVNSNGSVAVGIGFPSSLGVSGGIAFFDPSGRQIRLIDTGPYMPSNICFDHRDSLWTFGWQRASDRNNMEEADYMMFRKYSVDGKELGRFIPRSLFPKGLAPGGPQGGLWRIRAADDRVGALAFSGNTSEIQVWIELALDGRLIGDWPVGRDAHGGLAFTAGARLCRQAWVGNAPTVECFDRNTAAWKSTGPSPVRGLLLGSQGEQLAFSRDDGLVNVTLATIP